MYQDIFVNGEVVEKGVRECSLRYEAVRAVCAGLGKGFTVLDFGCNAGYFGLRLAREFGARVVFVDDDPALPEIVARNEFGGLVVRQRLTAKELAALPVFDLVMAFSVLHHVDDWQRAAQELLRAGRCAIIETPEPTETALVANPTVLGPMHAWFMERGPSILMKSASWLPNGGTRPLMCFSPLVRVGTVFKGGGWTTKQFPDYQTEIEAAFGGTLFPGSLNLILDRPLVLVNPIHVSSKYGDIRVFRGTVGAEGLPYLLAKMPEAEDNPGLAELFAAEKLRDKYALSDGSSVVLTVGKDHVLAC